MEVDYEVRAICLDSTENMPIKPSLGKTLEYCQNAMLTTPDVNYFFWQDGQFGTYTTRCTFHETCKEDEKSFPNRPGILYRARKTPRS